MSQVGLPESALPPPDAAERAALEREVMRLRARAGFATLVLLGSGCVAAVGIASAVYLGHELSGLQGADRTTVFVSIVLFTLGAPFWMPVVGLSGAAVGGIWLQSLSVRIGAREARLAQPSISPGEVVVDGTPPRTS